ncbi:hypothetical protein PU634_10465 [Oceanimonas pelagia]|uniref:Uncharacterized protein n=1 Tax=Oceanimonas pelagia TaxID=3028314 RepID=A0AA50KL45_9GAMM|nr:hypothetical protein [Oceanimonas pelagia]WMC09539.1 hypothetical protein PU634_10465 [Oceanimonas pelagia]
MMLPNEENFLCLLNDVRREHTQHTMDEADLLWEWLLLATKRLQPVQLERFARELVEQAESDELGDEAVSLLKQAAEEVS